MDLRPAINALPKLTMTVTRRAIGSVGTDGFYNEGSTSTFTISGTVYNPTPKELQRLEEGFRIMQAWSIITATELYTGSKDGYQPDWVQVKGTRFEVANILDHSHIGNFYHVLVVAVQQ